jgi:hypothetical protein
MLQFHTYWPSVTPFFLFIVLVLTNLLLKDAYHVDCDVFKN